MFRSLVRRVSGAFSRVNPYRDTSASHPSTDSEPVQIGTKRRRSFTGPDDEEEQTERKYATLKRNKGDDTVSPDGEQQAEFFQREESPKAIVPPEKETNEVKEVTQGVNDVHLEESVPASAEQPQSEKPGEASSTETKDVDSQALVEEDESLTAALETPLPADRSPSPVVEGIDASALAAEPSAEATDPSPAQDVSEEPIENNEAIASESMDHSASETAPVSEHLVSEVAHPEREATHSGEEKTEKS